MVWQPNLLGPGGCPSDYWGAAKPIPWQIKKKWSIILYFCCKKMCWGWNWTIFITQIFGSEVKFYDLMVWTAFWC